MSRAAELSRSFVKTQPARAARALDQVPAGDVAAFFASIGEAEAAAVLAHMQPTHAAAVLEASAPQKSASILREAPAYVRALLIRALPAAAQQSIIKAAPRRQGAALSRFLSYDPGTVGAWMDAPGATFAPDTQVGDCLRELRRLGSRLSPSLFVIDKDRRLLGTVELEALLAAADDETVQHIMQRGVVTIAPQASLASVVSLEAWDSTLALPVTDSRRRLVGSLRFDALREGLDVQHAKPGELHLNMVLMHMAQALLVSLSGMLQVAATEPRLSRLSGETEQR